MVELGTTDGGTSTLAGSFADEPGATADTVAFCGASESMTAAELSEQVSTAVRTRSMLLPVSESHYPTHISAHRSTMRLETAMK